jgi:hypothetical protein
VVTTTAAERVEGRPRIRACLFLFVAVALAVFAFVAIGADFARFPQLAGHWVIEGADNPQALSLIHLRGGSQIWIEPTGLVRLGNLSTVAVIGSGWLPGRYTYYTPITGRRYSLVLVSEGVMNVLDGQTLLFRADRKVP